jgi:hypothetical protein
MGQSEQAYKDTDLADKVSIFFFLLKGDDILPNAAIGTLVSLAGTLQLGHKRSFLFFLLRKVLLKRQSIVFFLGLFFPAWTALAFRFFGVGRCGSSGGCTIRISCRCGPRVLSRVVDSSPVV